jgi:hypothetical protein
MVASYHHGAKSYSRHFGAGANLMLLVKVTLMHFVSRFSIFVGCYY